MYWVSKQCRAGISGEYWSGVVEGKIWGHSRKLVSKLKWDKSTNMGCGETQKPGYGITTCLWRIVIGDVVHQTWTVKVCRVDNRSEGLAYRATDKSGNGVNHRENCQWYPGKISLEDSTLKRTVMQDRHSDKTYHSLVTYMSVISARMYCCITENNSKDLPDSLEFGFKDDTRRVSKMKSERNAIIMSSHKLLSIVELFS